MSKLAGILALCLAIGLPAQAPAATVEQASEEEVIKARAERDQRMTVPVRIGEHGTYRFVIDTGSQTTVIAKDLADRIAMERGRRARIIGVAGVESVDTAIAEELVLGRRSLYGMEVALLEGAHIGADGIVGIDSLQDQRVMLDFRNNTMAVGNARTLGGNGGFEIVVTARRRLGQLIMTDAVIDGVRADVIVDTGADTSIGNRALQRALNSRRTLSAQVTLKSVTGQEIVADLGFPRKLDVGDITITNLIVAFADAPVFDVLNLNRRPAMMLGMRELRIFKRVAIDFPTRRVMFDLPQGS